MGTRSGSEDQDLAVQLVMFTSGHSLLALSSTMLLGDDRDVAHGRAGLVNVGQGAVRGVRHTTITRLAEL